MRISRNQRRGEVFAPMHWTDLFASSGPVGRLVGAARDPVSGQPELKATAVAVAPVSLLWCGLLLRRAEAPLTGEIYWSRIPIESGAAFDLAGIEPLPGGEASERWIAALLDVPPGAELVVYADPGRGVFRYASLVDGRLDACLFLGRSAAALPERAALAALLGSPIEARRRAALLAGRAAGTVAAEAGPIVCACFAVGLGALQDTIVGRRLTSVAEIGRALRAGTNCGSCISELKEILRHARAGAAA